MKVGFFALALAALLLPSQSRAQEPEQFDTQRREVMASKQYAKNCKRFSKMTAKAVAANGEPYPVKVICRTPPVYPEKCLDGAKRREVVRLRFDVRPDGYTTNIRLIESTNQCQVEAAASSLFLWRFEASGAGAADLETDVTFEFFR